MTFKLSINVRVVCGVGWVLEERTIKKVKVVIVVVLTVMNMARNLLSVFKW